VEILKKRILLYRFKKKNSMQFDRKQRIKKKCHQHLSLSNASLVASQSIYIGPITIKECSANE